MDGVDFVNRAGFRSNCLQKKPYWTAIPTVRGKVSVYRNVASVRYNSPMKRGFLLVAATAAIVVAGCSKPVVFTGTWEGKVAQAPAGLPAPSGITLTVKEDKTFDFALNSGGMPVTISGTWVQDGSKLTLSNTKMMGQDIDTVINMAKSSPMVSAQQKAMLDDAKKPWSVEAQADGTAKSTGGVGGAAMTFTKKG
jgi:hypothetical protein